MDAPAPERRGWLATIAPAYLGVFVWFPFLDLLGVDAPGWAGLTGRLLSAALAVFCCYGLLYYPSAALGWRSGRRLAVVAAESFGAAGAEWITGVLYGLFAGVLCAVSIYYSVKLTLLGLASWTLLGPELFEGWKLGPLRFESPLVLISLGFWLFIITAANGLRLMNVIAALMKVYSPVALALLGLIATWTLIGPGAESPAASTPTGDASPSPALLDPRVFQLIFGGFAFAGLMGVEWGGAAASRKDVRIGGWVAILGGGTFAALAALVISAGDPGFGSQGLDWEIPSGSLRGALFRGVGGSLGNWAAGALLLLFGLSSLAPACYASKVFADRCRGHWSSLRGWTGTLVGYGLIFAFMAGSLAARLETIFILAGAAFAPAAGVLAIEAALNRRERREVRPGWRAPGVAAWVVGVAVGLAPLVRGAPCAPLLGLVQPAALFAFATAAAVYALATLAFAEGPLPAVVGSGVSEES